MQNYTVQAGDTLNKIAQKFGFSDYKKAGLVAKSGNPNLIRPGETYNINPAATSPKDTYTASLTNTNPPPQNTGTGESAASTPPANDPFSSYRKYLSSYADSLQENPDVTTARENLVNIQNTQDVTSLAARKAYEDALNAPGMLKSGAQETAASLNKDNSYILANLGVAESGAARKLGALTDASTAKSTYLKNAAELNKPIQLGDNYYDPNTGKLIPNTKAKAAFELSPGQSRYEYDPETGTYKEIAKLAPLPKAPVKQTEAEKKQVMVDDVNSAVNQLGKIVKAKGFKGVSPDDYNTMRAYLQETYGYEGVAELDKALATLGLVVDTSSK